MAESAEQIRRHIAALTEFEQKYTEYLVADRESRAKGSIQYSAREWRERDREIRKLAPRADAAVEASGVGGLALYGPPAVGSPLIADDLASLIFHVKPSAFGNEAPDDAMRQDIADRLPTQIAGLEMRLEEAEAREGSRGRRVVRTAAGFRPEWKWLHEPNPWILGIGVGLLVTVVGGLIVAVIVSG
jgi:hypothetical protein